MIDRRLLLLLALICITCKPAARQPEAPAAGPAGPQVRATVVTIRTNLEPAKRTFTHTLIIADGRARSTSERDSWRLYDLKAKRVTYVDDAMKTQRSESFEEIVRKRRTATAAVLPPHYPPARLHATGQTRAVQGVQAKQSVIELGAYRRELWLAEHPSIPAELFAMMQLSDPPSSPLAPMMHSVEEALAKVRGFPFVDHSELPYGKNKHIVDRQVIGVAQKDVPQTMLTVPKEYKDVTPRGQGAGGRAQ